MLKGIELDSLTCTKLLFSQVFKKGSISESSKAYCYSMFKHRE